MTDQEQASIAQQTAQDEKQVQMRIEKVYLKDASFESPKSPEVFTRQWQPNLSVDINTRATPLADDRHEVVLTITVRANVEDVPWLPGGNSTGRTVLNSERGRFPDQPNYWHSLSNHAIPLCARGFG